MGFEKKPEGKPVMQKCKNKTYIDINNGKNLETVATNGVKAFKMTLAVSSVMLHIIYSS